MYSKHITRNFIYADHAMVSPMIDGEFDRFNLNTDFEMSLREAEPANFYHDALNEEE